jgi:hypothetical protein
MKGGLQIRYQRSLEGRGRAAAAGDTGGQGGTRGGPLFRNYLQEFGKVGPVIVTHWDQHLFLLNFFRCYLGSLRGGFCNRAVRTPPPPSSNTCATSPPPPMHLTPATKSLLQNATSQHVSLTPFFTVLVAALDYSNSSASHTALPHSWSPKTRKRMMDFCFASHFKLARI